jgi:prokaryotic ubiquitin-like protein Pup
MGRVGGPEAPSCEVTARRHRQKGQELAEKLGDLMDEIAEVLEENAEEFVKGYIQRVSE